MEPVQKHQKLEGNAADGFNAESRREDGLESSPLETGLDGCPRPRCPQLPADAKVIILDVEGATTLISFVHQELFPFARQHCRSFLEANFSDPAVQHAVSLMRTEAAQDVQRPEEYPRASAIPEGEQLAVIDAVVTAVEWQMDMDRKAGGLKALQGLIWKDGYASGELRGHVFQDVPYALRWWKQQGVSVYIYSSGSVGAQKLLFGSSKHGDLLPFLTGHFDTAVGSKLAASSYAAIAAQLGVPAREVVFVSDSEGELVAARDGGIGWPVMCVRPGNRPLTALSNGLPVARSLLELCRAAGE